MFQKSAIESLIGRVGFSQSTIPEYAILDTDNLKTDSGYLFNESSGLVTTKNIKECQENKDISDDDFNEYVQGLQRSAITQVLNKVFYDKGAIMETVLLFPFEHKFDDTLELSDKFVGFRINVGTNRRLLTTIKNVVLSFNGADTFNIHLYNSNVKVPIKTKEVTVSDGDTIVDLDWDLPKNTATYKGGAFYLGYFESDVTVKPYSREYELGNVNDFSVYNDIEFVRLPNTGTVIDVDGDTITEPMGLNMEFETKIDYTDLIESKKSLFDRAIMYQMANVVLGVIYTTTRSNITQRLGEGIKSFAFADLNGDKELGSIGMISKAAREIISIRKSLFSTPRIRRGTMR